MNVISREDLKQKIDCGENVKLVMAMGRHAYEWLHIPGSLHFDTMGEAIKSLDRDDEVIVYCSNPLCQASVNAYLVLRSHGFKKLWRYAGGLVEWQDAGYPLEGSLATTPVAA